MQYWGLEFVDDGCYGKQTPVIEPWRAYENVFQLPLRYIRDNLSDKHLTGDIATKERKRIQALQLDIWENGLQQPLLIQYDMYGNALLKDGHHRLLALEYLYGENCMVPVTLEKLRSLKGYGTNVLREMETILGRLAS